MALLIYQNFTFKIQRTGWTFPYILEGFFELETQFIYESFLESQNRLPVSRLVLVGGGVLELG